MDCNKAGDAMMQYMDKTIKPAEAKALALHLLNCEPCREYFTALDMTMDALECGGLEFTEAPAGFTESVMAKVNELPVYQEKPKKVRNYNVAIRIAGGLSVVLTGIILLITSGAVPSGALSNTLLSVGAWFGGVRDGLVQNGAGTFFKSVLSSTPDLSITALIFASVISLLLFALQRGEHHSDNVKA